MPHISKKTLQRKTFKHISKDLTVLIASLRSKSEIKTFLGELLTPTRAHYAYKAPRDYFYAEKRLWL